MPINTGQDYGWWTYKVSGDRGNLINGKAEKKENGERENYSFRG